MEKTVMEWLLIVFVAGNFHFAKIADTEVSCQKMGEFYTVGIQHEASYVCVNAETVRQKLME